MGNLFIDLMDNTGQNYGLRLDISKNLSKLTIKTDFNQELLDYLLAKSTLKLKNL